MIGDDVAVRIETVDGFQSASSTGYAKRYSKGEEYLIGRLKPIYVSIRNTGSDSLSLLVAGLDNLCDDRFAFIEIYR